MTNAFGAIDLFSGSKSISGKNLFKVDKNPLNVLSTDFSSLAGNAAVFEDAVVHAIDNIPIFLSEVADFIIEIPLEILKALLSGSGASGILAALLAELGVAGVDILEIPVDFLNEILSFFGLGLLPGGSPGGTVGSTLGADVTSVLAIPFDFINAVLGALGLGTTHIGTGSTTGATLGGALGDILSGLATFLADTGLSGSALAALVTSLTTDVSTVVSDLDTIFSLTSTDATSLAALINALAPGAVASLSSLLALLGLSDVPSLASFLTSIEPNFLPIIPASHVRNVNPELLFNPGFDTSASIGAGVGYTWDGTVGHLSPGSAKAVADGATKFWMVSNPVAVAQGDQIVMSIWVQWSSVTTSGSSPAPIRLEVQPYGTILFTDPAVLRGKGALSVTAVATKFTGLTGHPTGHGTLTSLAEAQNTTTHVYNRYAALHGKGVLSATATVYSSRQTIGLHGRGVLSAAVKAVFTDYADIPTVLQSVATPATNSTWVQLKGTYPVPAGVNTVYLQPVVDTTATAGSVWFDDGSIVKSGDLVGGTGLVDTMANLFTNLFGSNILGAELTQVVIPELTALWGKTIDGSLLSGITAVEQQIVDAIAQALGQSTGHVPADLQGFLSTALGDLLSLTTWDTFLADANTALDTAGSDLASLIGGLGAIPYPNILSVLGGNSLGDDLSNFVNAVNTAATVTGGMTTSAFSNALSGLAALLGFDTTASPGSGSVAGVTTTNSTYIAQRAATKGTYIGVDPTGDPTFNFSQLAGASLPTIDVAVNTSIFGLIGTPDGGTKKAVAWYAPNALPLYTITSVTINVYSVNLTTGECDLLSSSGNIASSVVANWNYYDLDSSDYVNAQQGLWYAVEMAVTGTGVYTIAGLQHQAATHPFAVPSSMAATRAITGDVTTSQSGTSVPAGVLGCYVTVIGGGGGGHGGGTSGTYGGGGGGGGGVISTNFIPVASLGGTYSCSPGAGGTAGAAAGNGGNGSASTFSSGSISISAAGGHGGTSNATAGAGGTANSISGATASLNVSGTSGGNGASGSGGGTNAANNSSGGAPGGGGGAISGNGGNGGNSLLATGGGGGVGQTNGTGGGSTYAGYPGAGAGGGGASSSPGNAGTGALGGSYGGGGGGGGGKAGVSGNSAGGAGGVGGVLITWITAPTSTTPTYSNANVPFMELTGEAGPITHPEDRTTFTASGTYTVPAWANSFDVVIVGAGGGAHAWTGLAGHGGGGGSWNAATYTAAQVGSTMTVTVGAGGEGGIYSGSAATNGSSTSVNTNGSGGTLSASGGTAAANSSKTGLSPGSETFNTRYYQGGFDQNITSAVGNSPGGGGAGGGQGGTFDGGDGSDGAVFIVAYQ